MRGWTGIARSYAAAVALSGAAVVLALLLAGATGGRAGHLFTAAVALAAWSGGLGPGLVAAGLGGLALDYFFEDPVDSLRPQSLNTALNLVVFLLVGGVIAWTNARLRASRAELAAALDAVGDAVIVHAADG